MKSKFGACKLDGSIKMDRQIGKKVTKHQYCKLIQSSTQTWEFNFSKAACLLNGEEQNKVLENVGCKAIVAEKVLMTSKSPIKMYEEESITLFAWPFSRIIDSPL